MDNKQYLLSFFGICNRFFDVCGFSKLAKRFRAKSNNERCFCVYKANLSSFVRVFRSWIGIFDVKKIFSSSPTRNQRQGEQHNGDRHSDKQGIGRREIIVRAGYLFGGITLLGFDIDREIVRKEVVRIAKEQVGIIERNPNRGKRIDDYRSTSLKREVVGWTDPWCGYFVGYVFMKAGVNISFVKAPPVAASWFEDKKRLVYAKNMIMPVGVVPQPGDVVGYIFKSGRISHIGIIVEWNEDLDYFFTVEGNTSNKQSVMRDSNQNDGVRLKKRDKSMAWKIARIVS